MDIMGEFIANLFFLVLMTNGLIATNALIPKGPSAESVPVNRTLLNLFAPNFKIINTPASRTVNLDFRTSNAFQIRSGLSKALTGLLQDGAVKHEKVILNITPPKNSNSTFLKDIIRIVKNDMLHLVPNAVVGAKTTTYKKKSGEIKSLHLTLFVIREQSPTLQKKIAKSSFNNKFPIKTDKPKIEEAKINITQTENITEKIESVLQQLHGNSTDNGNNETDILLSLVASKNFTKSQIDSLKNSIKLILHQLYPDVTISVSSKLFYRRKSHISKLQFEIDIKPLKTVKPLIVELNITIISFSSNSSTPNIQNISINGTNSIRNSTNTLDHYIQKVSRNITESGNNKMLILLKLPFSRTVEKREQQILEQTLIHSATKNFPHSHSIPIESRVHNSSILDIGVVLVPKIEKHKKFNSPSITSPEEDLKMVQKYLDDLVPYSQILIGDEGLLNRDLSLLKNLIKYQETETEKRKIHIPLRKNISHFDTELDRILPGILEATDSTKKPVSLDFEVTIPSDHFKSTSSSDICFIVKSLIHRIHQKAKNNDVNIKVTLASELTKNSSTEESTSNRIRSQNQISNRRRENNGFGPTENGTNISSEIDESLPEILNGTQARNYSMKNFNLSMIIPLNETNLSEEYILNVIRRDMKILFPYSRILIQAQKVISDDLHSLDLNLGLIDLYETSYGSKEPIEHIPVDLTNLGKNIQDDLRKRLIPLWSNINNRKPLSFDLQLRPANDIARPRLANEICSIVDVLSKSLPLNLYLSEISLRMTVIPDDNIPSTRSNHKEQYHQDLKKHEFTPKLLNVTYSSKNISNQIREALKHIVEGSKNAESGSKQNLSVHLPQNSTRHNIEDILKKIRDDLSKLAPYEDVIIKSQKHLENYVHRLELDIDLHHEKPRKLFRIQLTEDGDFLPEEVDQIVFDLRKSKNLFSFNLQMVIPRNIDLEASISEICSVNNVVINNIPRQSILKDNVLRITLLPEENASPKQSASSTEPQEVKINKEATEKYEEENMPITTRASVSYKSFRMINLPSVPSMQRETTYEEDNQKQNEYQRTPLKKTTHLKNSMKNSEINSVTEPSYSKFRTRPAQPFQQGRNYAKNFRNNVESAKVNTSPKSNFYIKPDNFEMTTRPRNLNYAIPPFIQPVVTKSVISKYHKTINEPTTQSSEENNKEYKYITEMNESESKNYNSNTKPNAVFEPTIRQYSTHTTKRNIFRKPEISKYATPSYIQPPASKSINSKYYNKIFRKTQRTQRPKLRRYRSKTTESSDEYNEEYQPFTKLNETEDENEIYEEPGTSQNPKMEELLTTTIKPTIISKLKGFGANILRGLGLISPANQSLKTSAPPTSTSRPLRKEIEENIELTTKSEINETTESTFESKYEEPSTVTLNTPSWKELRKLKSAELRKSHPISKRKQYIPSQTRKISNSLYRVQEKTTEAMTDMSTEQEIAETTPLYEDLWSKISQPPSNNELGNVESEKLEKIYSITTIPNPARKLQAKISKATTEPPTQQEITENIKPSTVQRTYEEPLVKTIKPSVLRKPQNWRYKKLRKINSPTPRKPISVASKTRNSQKEQTRKLQPPNSNESNESHTEQSLFEKVVPTFSEPNSANEEYEKIFIPSYVDTVETTPIKAGNNNQDHVVQLIENLDLSNTTSSLDEAIKNSTYSSFNIIPNGVNETLELTLKIIPPKNITISYLANTTKSLMSSLISSLPGDIVNVRTSVGKEHGNIVYTEIKITLSPNNTLGRLIEEKQNLKKQLQKESNRIKNLTTLLKTLKNSVHNELIIQNGMRSPLNQQSSQTKEITDKNIERNLRNDVYSILSKILLGIKTNPNSDNLNLNYTIKLPTEGNIEYGYQLSDLLKKLLAKYMPFEEVKTEVLPMKNNNSLLQLQVSLKPRRNFATAPIDLDHLNILDVESILTKIISKFTTAMQDINSNLKSIIIDFVFKTTRISSLNLENIESAIEDVLNASNLKSKLIPDEVKLGLIKNKFFIIHIPFEISALNTDEESDVDDVPREKQKVKIPKPSEIVSDLIIPI